MNYHELEIKLIEWIEDIVKETKNELIKYYTNVDKIDGVLRMSNSTLLSLKNLKKELKDERISNQTA